MASKVRVVMAEVVLVEDGLPVAASERRYEWRGGDLAAAVAKLERLGFVRGRSCRGRVGCQRSTGALGR